eukprot:gene8323-9214_t
MCNCSQCENEFDDDDQESSIPPSAYRPRPNAPLRRSPNETHVIGKAALQEFGNAQFEEFYDHSCSQKHVQELAESKDIIVDPALSHVVHRRLKNVLKNLIWDSKYINVLVECLLVLADDDTLVPFAKAFEKEKETKVGCFKDSIGHLQNFQLADPNVTGKFVLQNMNTFKFAYGKIIKKY